VGRNNEQTSVAMNRQLWEAFKGLAWSQGLYANPLLESLVQDFLERHEIDVSRFEKQMVRMGPVGRPSVVTKV
jgi:hypothetical protein